MRLPAGAEGAAAPSDAPDLDDDLDDDFDDDELLDDMDDDLIDDLDDEDDMADVTDPGGMSCWGRAPQPAADHEGEGISTSPPATTTRRCRATAAR